MPTKREEVDKLHSRANGGDIVSQCLLAEHYLSSDNFEATQQGLRFLRKAAHRGDRWAQYTLGVEYEQGNIAGKSISNAMKWYQKAAEQRYDSAQLNLGIIHANRRGTYRNLKEAVRLFRLAARQGNRNAAYNLGLYYEEGRGVRKDMRRSLAWYLNRNYSRSRLRWAV